jgi:prevent-host-death family protein
MVDTVNIDDAKTRFSRLVERVEAGEAIVIGRAGKPVARLVPIDNAEPRKPGMLKGLQIPDGFLDPLSEAELADWE